WRRMHLVGADKPSLLKDFLADNDLTYNQYYGICTRVLATVREALWPSHDFLGLPEAVRNILLRNDIRTVPALYAHVSDIILDRTNRTDVIGPVRYKQLEEWLAAHEHDPLAPRLDPAARK